MVKKIFIGALLLIAIAIAGCSDEASNDRVVAVSFPNTTSSWQRNGDSIKRFLEEDNFVVDIQFAGSASEQSSQKSRSALSSARSTARGWLTCSRPRRNMRFP